MTIMKMRKMIMILMMVGQVMNKIEAGTDEHDNKHDDNDNDDNDLVDNDEYDDNGDDDYDNDVANDNDDLDAYDGWSGNEQDRGGQVGL